MSMQLVCAKETKVVTLSFNPQDFILEYDAKGRLNIGSFNHIVFYEENVETPCLPIISYSIIIPESSFFSGMTLSVDKRLLLNDVVLADAPIPQPIGRVGFDERDNQDAVHYEKKIFPDSVVNYVGTEMLDGYKVINLFISPFEYDASDNSLYFANSITLNVNLETTESRTSVKSNVKKNMREMVRTLVINKDEVEDNSNLFSITNALSTEYIIITSKKLSSAFYSLALWKKMKGINSRIITIEEIEESYEGRDIQQKIKSCLFDLYQNEGLKYVLLGGDDSVVPVRKCYVTANAKVEKEMPTDLYYACFEKDFTWDGDNDGIYGETTDNVSLYPSIFVTRVPVRSHTDTESFVSKILCYERDPNRNNWNNGILMAGVKLWNNNINGSQSDAQVKSENLYNSYIAPYWNGNRSRFYDTYTDFEGNENFNLTADNLNKMLSTGYAFFDMATHGGQPSWGLEKTTQNNFYVREDALSFANPQFSIITTMSCLTNAFDDSYWEPCLSEAFIRGRETGVIAYLGCSRYGWGYRGGTSALGPSFMYDAQFYKYLFSKDFEEKKFGVVVALAKSAMVNNSLDNRSERWIQFGLNPIGDPEMPIYTDTPKSFESVVIDFFEDSIYVNTGIEGCTICLMSEEDYGSSYYIVKTNVRETVFKDISKSVSICITKQNYIPHIKTIKYECIQNEVITDNKNYDADIIKIGSSVTKLKDKGAVIVRCDSLELIANEVVIDSETTILNNTTLTIINK